MSEKNLRSPQIAAADGDAFAGAVAIVLSDAIEGGFWITRGTPAG